MRREVRNEKLEVREDETKRHSFLRSPSDTFL